MLTSKQIKSSASSYSVIIMLLITFQFTGSQDCVAQYYCRNTSFSACEKLTYNVYYNLGFINIKLADVVLWVEETKYNNKSVFLVQNSTNTVQKYEWIIKKHHKMLDGVMKSK